MGILSLLMRPSFGGKPRSQRFFRVTSPGWLGGDGSAGNPLTGPETSDVTFTAVVAGAFYWSAVVTSSESPPPTYSVKKNGSVIASGTIGVATLLSGSTSVAVNDTIRFETGVSINGGNLQVWIV